MVFFVSGGSRGLGARIVLDAAAQGHDVAFTYLERASEAQQVMERACAAGGGRCRAYQLDVRDSSSVDDVGNQVLDHFGGVDVVVANAGIKRDGLAATMPDEDWDVVLATNLTGAFFVVRQFLPTFIASGWGRIILISSVSSRGMSGQANYAASKAGLLGLCGSLAREYGPKGITSNVILPGLLETQMSAEVLSGPLGDMWRRLCPAGRAGTPADVSQLVLFLASQAAAFVNGQTISVSGGLDWLP